MNPLDQEERELLESYERDEWQAIAGKEAESERYRQVAKATFSQDERVKISISQKDLMVIQQRALEEGQPYQELISSVLHKYASGQLREIES